MKIIGITGGIGTGKSAVAEILRRRGWVVLSSDETAREIMTNDTAVIEAVANLLGTDVIENGALNRSKIAELVFGSSEEQRQKLAALNKIVHPRVMDAHMQRITELADADCPLVAIETALLFETGLDEGMDYVIVVDAPEEAQLARAQQRSKLTKEQVLARIAQQMSMTEKRNHADFVIDNSGTMADLEKATNTLANIIEILPVPTNND